MTTRGRGNRTMAMPPAPSGAAFFPSPTRDLAEGLQNLRTHGLTIFPGLLEGRSLQRARDALYRAAEEDEARGRQQAFSLDYAQDTSNRRVWNVLSRDPIFEDLAFHPEALAYVKGVLGWPALLGNLSANITGPGGGEMVLHADQIFAPQPWAPEPQGLNIAWCLDDFRESNGATRFVPGSHRLNRPPQGQEGVEEAQPLEAPAGSALIFESRVWHQTGNNRTTDEHRAGVFAWYTKPIYRPQENWFLSLRPEVREFASEEALILLGYRTEGLGLVHGRSPA